MLAINWFQLSIATPQIEIPCEDIAIDDDYASIDSLIHRTVKTRFDSGYRIFHIGFQQPPGTSLQAISFDQYPSVGKQIIEMGFGNRLIEMRYVLRRHEVGFTALRLTEGSLHPSIYQKLEGLVCRCYYFSEDAREAKDAVYHWGLILKYNSSQSFLIDLEDQLLQRMALGQRVVRLAINEINNHGEVSAQFLRSGILISLQNSVGVISDNRGSQHNIELKDWTLPCNAKFLSAYIRERKGSIAANEVVIRLQQDSLSLTSNRRMNTSIAKDQLDKLKMIMEEDHLLEFHLALPSKPLVRVSSDPYIIGGRQ